MLWFFCKSCGKRHSRPESEAGALIFCTCGNGVRVPFSSTAPAAPDIPQAIPTEHSLPVRPVPVAPETPRSVCERSTPARQDAQEVGPPQIPVARAVPVDIPLALPVEPIPSDRDEPAKPLRKLSQRYRKIDPEVCWNHENEATAGLCAGCRLPFCESCLVELRGQFVCGVCKNFRIASAGQPIRTFPMAIVAFLSSLVVGPVGLTLSLVGVGLFFGDGTAGPTLLLSVVALFPVAGALLLSLWVVRKLEGQTRLSGRALAMSGVCVSLAALLWCVCVIGLVVLGSGGDGAGGGG
ncbi:MAG: hypothetical protein SNJ82_11405 [Gemmataceae bacterium]